MVYEFCEVAKNEVFFGRRFGDETREREMRRRFVNIRSQIN